MQQQFTLPEISSGISKTSIQILADKTVEGILDNGNVLQVAEVLSAIEHLSKAIKGSKPYTEYLRNEIEKYGKSATLPNGTKIELAETGTKYDYSKCEDLILQRLEQKAESAANELKERQDFLKTVPVKGVSIIDEETGETFTVFPPSKTSNSSYKVTLSK
jgi:hypothetical protein